MRSVRAVLLIAVLLWPATAAAQDVGQLAQDVLAEQSCRALVAGTIGVPDEVKADPVIGIPATWATPSVPLPKVVELRTDTQTFNRLFEFALRDGRLYARARHAGAGAWRTVPLPACLDGRLLAISADDDEVLGLDAGRRVYTMDNALKEPALWNWSNRWGTLLWTGPGYVLPPVVDWTWTVISPIEDGGWTDPAGNVTPVGFGKVSHIWGIREGGQRLTFWDPWLPLDDSYEACGPLRGRFRSVAISASGSELFVVGAHGDMYTRLYDFDISGMDPVFFKYSYENQKGKGSGAPIQLPPEDWAHQPKIAGEITDAISVHKEGPARVLRVEGRQAGVTGYWERQIRVASGPWTFHATGEPLSGRVLDNPRRDTSTLGQGPGEDTRYVMRRGGVEAEIPDFSTYCSPAHLVVRENGVAKSYLLHHVDGLRQRVRGRGLDDTPREQAGAIEGPTGTFETVTLAATRSSITLKERGWTLTREPLPRVKHRRARRARTADRGRRSSSGSPRTAARRRR